MEESKVVLTTSGPLVSLRQEDIEPLEKEVATSSATSFKYRPFALSILRF